MNFFKTLSPPVQSFDEISMTGLPGVGGGVPAQARASAAADFEDLSNITGDVSDAALWRAHAKEYAALEARSAIHGQVSQVIESKT